VRARGHRGLVWAVFHTSPFSGPPRRRSGAVAAALPDLAAAGAVDRAVPFPCAGLAEQMLELAGVVAQPLLPALDDAERTDEPAAHQRNSNERARRHLLTQRWFRENRHRRRNLERLLDVLDVVELHDDVHGHVVLTEEAIHLPANDEVLVEADVLGGVELG